MPNISEIRPLLRDIEVLRGKESRLEKQLDEVRTAIDEKTTAFRKIVNAGVDEVSA